MRLRRLFVTTISLKIWFGLKFLQLFPFVWFAFFQCFPKIRRKIATTININYYLDCIHMAAIFLWLHIRVGKLKRRADVTPLCSTLQSRTNGVKFVKYEQGFLYGITPIPSTQRLSVLLYIYYTQNSLQPKSAIWFSFPDNFCMSLDCGWKPEYLEKTPRSLQCQVRTERHRPSRVLNPGSSCYFRQSTENSLTLRQRGTGKAKMLTVFWVLGLIYSTRLSFQLLMSQEVVKRNGLSDLPAFIWLASCNTAVLHWDFHREPDVRGKWPLFEYGLCKQHS